MPSPAAPRWLLDLGHDIEAAIHLTYFIMEEFGDVVRTVEDFDPRVLNYIVPPIVKRFESQTDLDDPDYWDTHNYHDKLYSLFDEMFGHPVRILGGFKEVYTRLMYPPSQTLEEVIEAAGIQRRNP